MQGNSHPNPTALGGQKAYLPVGLSPQQIVSAYHENQWEEFIQEWVQSLAKKYNVVQRFSGPGDKGRDVVGFVESADFSRPWDNYQCKHYDRPLSPTHVWLELGKLVYYSFIKDFSVPRSFKFVAPREVGPKLKDLLAKPKNIPAELIKIWPEHCEKKITESKAIALDPTLTKYISDFDFSIVGFCPVLQIIEEHMKTPHWTTRFKFSPPVRPPHEEPPDEITPGEMSYVKKLVDAYGDAAGAQIRVVSELTTTPRYLNHLKRSRQWFFQAEALNRFSRDHYPQGAFEDLKQQVYDGVVDTCEQDYTHGFDRVCAATDRAGGLALGNSDLAPHAGVGDKKGICHHLANEDKLQWVKK